jgi:hypothetical protein
MSLGDATGSVAEGGYRSRYGIDKLKEGNYPVWRWNCQALLEENEVWDNVTGQNKRPVKKDNESEPTDLDIKTWDTKDAKARRIIGFTVVDELQGPVREAGTAQEAWDELEKLHAPNDRQRQFALTRQLYACKMSSSTPLKDHEREFSAIVEALRATGKAVDKMDIITQYLLSLSEDYQTFALGLNMKIEDTWTFNTVKGMVRVEEQRVSNAATAAPSDTVARDPEAVKANFAKKSGKKWSKKFTDKCYHCGIPGVRDETTGCQ